MERTSHIEGDDVVEDAPLPTGAGKTAAMAEAIAELLAAWDATVDHDGAEDGAAIIDRLSVPMGRLRAAAQGEGGRAAERPGEPLPDPLRWRPASEHDLSPEAKARVQATIDDVNRARRIAARDAGSSIIG